MTNAAFETVYYPRYYQVIRALARKLARQDADLFDDLLQTGLIELWRLDPEKADTNEDAFIRQALYNRMVDVLRRTRADLFLSLDTTMEYGTQVAVEGATGDPVLLDSTGRRFMAWDPWLPNEDPDPAGA